MAFCFRLIEISVGNPIKERGGSVMPRLSRLSKPGRRRLLLTFLAREIGDSDRDGLLAWV